MPAAIPRPAASLILLREATLGPQVLLGRRSRTALAFPGAVVFPGGKVEPGDAEAEARAGLGPGPAPPGAAFAALRETCEETGLWLASAENGPGVFPNDPGLDRLSAYAHWITPARRPYRFDTWFFLAVARPAEATAPLVGEEFETMAWASPAAVLADPEAALLPPTRHTLQRLSRHATVAAMLADAHASDPFEAGDVETEWDGSGA